MIEKFKKDIELLKGMLAQHEAKKIKLDEDCFILKVNEVYAVGCDENGMTSLVRPLEAYVFHVKSEAIRVQKNTSFRDGKGEKIETVVLPALGYYDEEIKNINFTIGTIERTIEALEKQNSK